MELDFSSDGQNKNEEENDGNEEKCETNIIFQMKPTVCNNQVRLHWQWVHVVNMSAWASAHSSLVIRYNYIVFNRWKLSDEECWQFAMSQDDTTISTEINYT